MSLLSNYREPLVRFLRYGRHALPLADSLRGGVICVVPALLAVVLHMPMLCWSAIAAFWTCLADEPTRPCPWRHYDGLAFGVAAALASACAIAAHSVPVLSIAIVGALAYAGATMRARGRASGLRGLLTATACAVSACFPVHGLQAAAHYAGFYLVGNAWALAAGGGLWQTSGSKRAQQATLAFLHAMSSLASRLGQAAYGNRSRLEQGRADLRARLDAMTTAMADHRGTLPPACARWLVDAEQAMTLLAGLETLVADGYDAPRREAATRLAPAFGQLATLIDASAARIRDGSPVSAPDLGVCAARLWETLRECEPAWLAQRGPGEGLTWLKASAGLIERLSALLVCDDRTFPAPYMKVAAVAKAASSAAADDSRARGLRARMAGLLHAIGYSRYAARLSLAAMIAVGIARLTGMPQAYWLALTTLFILQPTLSQTVKVSSLRIGGTLLGAALASALSLFVHAPLLLALIVLPLATGSLAARTFSYVSYIFFLTSHFILVAHLGTPVGAPWALALARIEFSVAGVLVGFLTSLIAWPEREHHRIGTVAARAIEETAAYLHAMTNRLAQRVPRDVDSLVSLRRRACLAIDSLEATIAATRFESLLINQQAACASVLVQRLKTLVGAMCPVEYVDAILDEADLARLGGLAMYAQALITRDPSGDTLARRGGIAPQTASCHVREMEREVTASACVVHLLRPRVLC